MAHNISGTQDPWNDDPTHMQPTGDPPPIQEGDIVVLGRMQQTPWLFQPLIWGGPAYYPEASFVRQRGYVYDLYPNMVDAPLLDEDNHEVTVQIYRELTAAEQASIDRFIGDIARANRIINSLSDFDIIRIPGKADISGAEFKALWSKTDFVIHDNYWTYDNGTQRGEAAYQGGNAQISFNIATLQSYVDTPGMAGNGGLWVVMHELGHMTGVGRDLNAYFAETHLPYAGQESERFANDFARTITEHFVDTTVPFSPGSNSYSVEHGSIALFEIPVGDPPPEPNIPSWKFDSLDGTGLISIIS